LQGRGCPICRYIKSSASRKAFSERDVIERFKEVHGEKYDYNSFVYNGASENSIIICRTHGRFLQQPTNHLLGKGCYECGRLKTLDSIRKTTKEFIEEATQIHNNKYDYCNTNYFDSGQKVEIICPKHGLFEQLPHVHLRGSGCRKCINTALVGWSRSDFIKRCNNVGELYVIECFSNQEYFIKVGITKNNVVKRNPVSGKYKYRIISQIKSGPDLIWDLEQKIKKKLKHLQYIPNIKFGGYTECYIIESTAVIQILINDNLIKTN